MAIWAGSGGRMILLIYVLNVIYVFLLSFMKIYVKICKKLVKTQVMFLWGGVKGDSKIFRVK